MCLSPLVALPLFESCAPRDQDRAAMRQVSSIVSFATPGRGFTDITRAMAGWLAETDLSEGLLTLLCRHTSASLLIQENAASEVRTDLATWQEDRKSTRLNSSH